MKDVCAKTSLGEKSFLVAETELGLPGHTLLGERLAERWGLPVVIRKTIRYHHRDVEAMESIYPNMKPTIMLVSIANIVVKRLLLGVSGDSLKPDYPRNYCKALGLTEALLNEIETQMPAEMDRADAFLAASRSMS
jgi:HD-like signal output (HDOD) protein